MTTPAVVACPAPDNMAAIALQMQRTALETEATLFGIENLLSASLNRPMWVIDSTANVTGLVGFVDQFLLSGAAAVERFNNTGVDLNLSTWVELPFTGLWQVGFSCVVVASGAVTDNSLRDFKLRHGRPFPSPLGFVTIWEEDYILYETNTGTGVDGVVVAEFNAQAGDVVAPLIHHNNSGSTLTMNTPMRMWATLLSTPDQAKVVV